jgi:hypothetical protein
MKKQLARTLFMWVLYGVTLWVGFGWFGLPNAFMPMFMTFLGTSVPLGFALWESFIFMGMNDLRKDARDAELETWWRDVFAPLQDDLTWDVTIPAPNGYEFQIWWNGALTMWQGELWDVSTKPYSVCDRDVFVTKDEAIEWFVKTSKVIDRF